MTIFNEFIDRYLQNNSTKQSFINMVINIHKSRNNLSHNGLIPITMVNQKGNEMESVEYLIKMAPLDHALRKRKPYDKMYHREWIVYTDCLPEFKKFEKNKKIAKEFRFNSYPKYYAISLKPFEESLIVENLEASDNFRLWDKRYPMDENHIKLVLKEYAKFHALSFALKKQRPALMTYIENTTKDILLEILQKSQELDNMEILCNRLLETDEINDNSNSINKLNVLKGSIVQMMIDVVQNNRDRNRCVLIHGGNCFNDMLFSYKDPEIRGMPSEVKFIDWQRARYGYQILDIAAFIYTSFEAKSLRQLEEFLLFYHNSFLEHGERLKFDLNGVYTYTDFRKDWSKHAIFGFALAILVLYKIFIGKKSNPKKIGRDEENSNDDFLLCPDYIECERFYLRRILDVFKHFVDFGFI